MSTNVMRGSIWVVLAAPHPGVNFVATFVGDRLPDVRNRDSREVPMAMAVYFLHV